MTTSQKNPQVDGYLRKAKKWQDEQTELRKVLLGCSLKEEMKWMHPCYTLDGKNIVLIHAFKEYCAILFFKGALLKDPEGILRTIGNTQAGRQVRFTSFDQIVEMEPILKAYVREAIEVEKAGLKVKKKTTAEFAVPQELKSKFRETPAFKSAFAALTPGRQRAYLYYFAAAKQSKTREARIERYVPAILMGKGLED